MDFALGGKKTPLIPHLKSENIINLIGQIMFLCIKKWINKIMFLNQTFSNYDLNAITLEKKSLIAMEYQYVEPG